MAMQRCGGHQADNGGAIGVGDERPLPRPPLEPNMRHRLGIHFRYNQRDLGNHAERRAVVDDDRPPLDCGGRHVLADGAPGAEEGDVDAIEALGAELLHHVLPILEGELLPRGAAAREHLDAAVGEVAIGEDAEELLAHGAGDAHHRHGGPVLAEAHAHRGGGGAARLGTA